MEESDDRHYMIPIVALTYKAPEKIERCLAQIRSQTIDCLPIVIDNSDFPTRLYTKGINLGLRMAPSSDFVCIITDDAYLEKNAIKELVRYMEDHPECGITSPMQVKDGQITWCGSLQSFPSGRHDQELPVSPRETPWVNGACMMLRTAMIKEIGLLDENMRFICSDSDYSFTARSRGWKTVVVPSALVEHQLGLSGQIGLDPYIDRVKFEDLEYFSKKWVTGGLFKELEYKGEHLSNGVIRSALREWAEQKRRIPNA